MQPGSVNLLQRMCHKERSITGMIIYNNNMAAVRTLPEAICNQAGEFSGLVVYRQDKKCPAQQPRSGKIRITNRKQ